MRRVSQLSSLLCPLLVLLSPGISDAHVELTSPPPRLAGPDGGGQLKSGPCGQSANARTDTVTVFEPGATITVEWGEYINHPSYYRISFDTDGDDNFTIRDDMDSAAQGSDDPEAAQPVDDVILAYVFEDPNMASYSAQVTLPNVECENCTLQLIQFMYDKVGNGQKDEYYFQCADIALRAGDAGTGGVTGAGGDDGGTGGAADTGGGAGVGGSPTGGVDGGGGAVGAGGTTVEASGGALAAGGTLAAGGGLASGGDTLATGGAAASGGDSLEGTGASASGTDDEGGGGCSLVSPSGRGGTLSGLLAVAALGLLRRRRGLFSRWM